MTLTQTLIDSALSDVATQSIASILDQDKRSCGIAAREECLRALKMSGPRKVLQVLNWD